MTFKEHVRRFRSKTLPEKFQTVSDITSGLYYKLTRFFVRPVRMSFGAWMIAWPDVMGKNIRKGRFEENERRFIERLFKPGMVMLDVGAHNGFFSLLASGLVGKNGLIYAFEPSPRERKRLLLNLSINRVKNVRVEPLALGAAEGKTDFFVVEGRETGFNSRRNPESGFSVSRITVDVSTLDHIKQQRNIGSVDFIKMDVEGGELDVMKGGRNLLLQKPGPILMCEISDTQTSTWNYKAREIYEFLDRLGFKWFSILDGGYLRPAFVKEEFHENLVAVPKERLSEIEEIVKEVQEVC